MRLFQGKLLERIFSHLEAARTGRHQGPIVGEGAVELQQTQPYQFGDSLANMDVVGSMINAMVRDGARLADPAAARGHAKSIAPGTRRSAPPSCCWT